jgi:hypothetical protein
MSYGPKSRSSAIAFYFDHQIEPILPKRADIAARSSRHPAKAGGQIG